MASESDLNDAQKLVKKNKKACIANLCEIIHKKVLENNGRMPYKFMSTLIKENKKSFNWLTRDMVNSAYTRFKKKRRLEENPAKEQPTIFQIQVDGEKNSSLRTCISDITGETECITSTDSRKDGDNGSSVREKGGRPVGSTTSQKRKREAAIISMKNEITKEYERELKQHKENGTRLKNGELKQIIQKHKERCDLRDVNVPEITIRMRSVRKKPVTNAGHGGLVSPLIEIDDVVVKMILMMARIRQCLTPSTGLALVNSLIDKQPIQDKSIAWKQKFSSNETGTVGTKYWR